MATWDMVAGVPARGTDGAGGHPGRVWEEGTQQPEAALTIVELQDLVVDGRGHADGLAREVGVEVEAFAQGHARGRLAVARE